MRKFEKIKKEIIEQLNKVKYIGDLSDIGNEIGVVIGNYISDDETGYDMDGFIHGINHGISLTKSIGTHAKRLVDEFLKSDDSKIYFEKLIKKIEIQQNRYKRFEEWLKHNDFNLLMSRLISEHDEKYRKKCYDNGFMPQPNNKLAFLIDYIIARIKPIRVKKLNCCFPNKTWEFKGYYFQMIWGQGVITNVYNKNNLEHLLQV